ncbi:MAG: response regulator transcription factor [Chromatiales bacterium]|nr:response regulator transcription factor [Chromatiales bacterium]
MSSRPGLLLVDDDEVFCEVLGMALERRGLDVMVATDLSSARTILAFSRPAYAVVDLRIGQESGLELMEHISQLEPAPRTVLLTGYGSIATAVQAIKLGAVHYLTKPVSVNDVLAALGLAEGEAEPGISEQPLSVKRLEWEHIQRVLAEHDGNVSATARALGIHRRTLQRKLQKRPVQR